MQITKNNYYIILYFVLLLATDIFALFVSFEIALQLRLSLSQGYFLEFCTLQLQDYTWIGIIVVILLLLEKIYFIRYDFWSDTKRIFHALFFSFIAVFVMISLTKMPFEYSRLFLIFFSYRQLL